MRKLIVCLIIASLATAYFSGFAFCASNKQEDPSASCVEPAKGPIVKNSGAQSSGASPATSNTAPIKATVGKPAIDFEANAYHDGKFKNIKLSDYKGKWVVLCFYPGDYTFV